MVGKSDGKVFINRVFAEVFERQLLALSACAGPRHLLLLTREYTSTVVYTWIYNLLSTRGHRDQGADTHRRPGLDGERLLRPPQDSRRQVDVAALDGLRNFVHADLPCGELALRNPQVMKTKLYEFVGLGGASRGELATTAAAQREYRILHGTGHFCLPKSAALHGDAWFCAYRL